MQKLQHPERVIVPMSKLYVMSPKLRKYLKGKRKLALGEFQLLRHGFKDKLETAETLMYIYESIGFGEPLDSVWQEIKKSGYGDEHPCCVFGSRLLLSAIILMGEHWIKDNYLYLWNEIDELVQKYNLSEGN